MTPGRRTAMAAAAIFFALLFIVAWLLEETLPASPAPEQPIPFSHRVHAGRKTIACLFCHDTAGTSAVAGLPPLQTCMLCHRTVAIDLAPIARVRRDYDADDPVAWVKVAEIPDFAYFEHDVHLRANIDCGRCHGAVKEMDRVKATVKIEMGLCMDCHEKLGVTRDCFVCHR